MVTSKITTSFNIPLPKEIRLALNLQPGDTLEFYIQEDGSIVLKKEASLNHTPIQTALPIFEWVFEDEEDEEEELDDDECSSSSTELTIRR